MLCVHNDFVLGVRAHCFRIRHARRHRNTYMWITLWTPWYTIPMRKTRRKGLEELYREYRRLFAHRLWHAVWVDAILYIWTYYIAAIMLCGGVKSLLWAAFIFVVIPAGSLLIYYLRQLRGMMPKMYLSYSTDSPAAKAFALERRIAYMRLMRTRIHDLYTDPERAVVQLSDLSEAQLIKAGLGSFVKRPKSTKSARKMWRKRAIAALPVRP